MYYKNYISIFKEKIEENIFKEKNFENLKKEISTKVNEINNEYTLFFGDTTVFKLNLYDIEKCNFISEKIFKKFNNYLVYLNPNSFHITLTSFNNPYVLNTYDKDKIFSEIKKNESKIKNIFQKIENLKNETITFKTYKLDLTSAILIRVFPKKEKDYLLLMKLRNIFDKLNENKSREIDFYLPHISLGYLNNKINKNKLNEISEYIKKTKISNFEITVKVKDLFYQYHNHMGEFIDLYNFN